VIFGSGYCTLINLANGLALDNEGSTTEGNGIWQWTPSPGNTNQEWQFVIVNTAPQSGSVYNLLCEESGMVLDNGGSTSNGAGLIQNQLAANDTNQEWELTSASSGYYNLVCQDSGKALDDDNSTSSGSQVIQWTLTSGDSNQEWAFNSQGSGYYALICLGSGLALDNDNSNSAGNQVIQYSPNGGSTQSWQLNLVP
jgi:hypothetical protein